MNQEHAIDQANGNFDHEQNVFAKGRIAIIILSFLAAISWGLSTSQMSHNLLSYLTPLVYLMLIPLSFTGKRSQRTLLIIPLIISIIQSIFSEWISLNNIWGLYETSFIRQIIFQYIIGLIPSIIVIWLLIRVNHLRKRGCLALGITELVICFMNLSTFVGWIRSDLDPSIYTRSLFIISGALFFNLAYLAEAIIEIIAYSVPREAASQIQIPENHIEQPSICYCTNCGKKIKTDLNFCPYCGFKRIK